MSSAWILANGPLRVGRTPPPAPDLVIAADGGARHAAALGVTVDYWIGDFDSARSGQLPQPVDPERRVLPTDKDLLDSEAALGLAASLGARRIVIWGGLGGRSDHALALLLVALRWRPRFSELVLRSGREWALPLLPGHLELELAAGQELPPHRPPSELILCVLQGMAELLTGEEITRVVSAAVA